MAKIPQAKPTDTFYLFAFFECDTERTHGQGVAKIPRSAIVDFAEQTGMCEDAMYELVYVVRRMDDAHTERMMNRLQNSAPKP